MKRVKSGDPVTEYAKAVTAGLIVAGPHVRSACKRHLADLKHGAKRGLRFDVAASNRAIGFFRDVLTVEIEAQDQLGDVVTRVVRFVLEGWQAFIVGSLFGWKDKRGFRRFRRAYVEVAKGNGKSPLAAGIGHYMLTALRKKRAEVYSAATDKQQAAILFRDAVAMWERSPALRRRLRGSGSNPVWALSTIQPGLNSFFKPIAAERKGKSGDRVYCGLVDEVHEHPDNSVIEMLRAGTKGNQEALIFEITNSGFDKKSVCGQEHDTAVRILNGEIENDAWFVFVASLDEGDDPLEDESCWPKANPNLGVSIQPTFIREQVAEARALPSKEGLVRRLHFCQWTESEKTAIPRSLWTPCLAKPGQFDPDKLTKQGYPCFGGLDLSRVRDLSCFTLTWLLDPTRDKWKFYSRTWFWTPKDTLAEREKIDRAQYQLWEKQGHLEAVPGKRISYRWVAQALGSLNARFHPRLIAGDQYGLEQLLEQCADLGVVLPVTVHPQGFNRRVLEKPDAEKFGISSGAEEIALWMPDSINKFEAALLEQRIFIEPNPVMNMCASSVVYAENRTGHRMFDKSKATHRIDGMVSEAMSIGAATLPAVKPKPDLNAFLKNPVIA